MEQTENLGGGARAPASAPLVPTPMPKLTILVLSAAFH